ncbi:MAG: DUF4254 domain-containing protein [Planctomycetia bacterium]|nr:DUF4254 domain-containing protein [Planctomycetia bacterium]
MKKPHQPPADLATIDTLLSHLVDHWHRFDPEHSEAELRGRICDLHRYNFLLWHEEDVARAPHVTDGRIAQVKRAIDRYNQLRNDCIEKVDDWLIADLADRGIVAAPGAPAATETPGAAIDRLSILELRRYHMREQIERKDATPEHIEKAASRLAILDLQRQHLVDSTDRLLTEIFAGERPLRVFRQMKMYNDPTMNPYLYNAAGKAA